MTAKTQDDGSLEQILQQRHSEIARLPANAAKLGTDDRASE